PSTRNRRSFGYWYFQGTSMAAPHVSGVAALLYAQGITSPDEIRNILQSTAEDLGAEGRDNTYGWGLVNAFEALQATVGESPIAEAGGPYSGDEGSLVTFDGSGSSDPDGTIDSYEWDFGDSATGTGANPTHTYIDNGIYTTTITVTDNMGMTDTDTASVTVSNVAPTAEAGGPYSGEEGAEITLAGNATDPGADTFTYAWDLDDNGAYETPGRTVADVWTSDGPYTVGLQVTDDDGGVGTDTATVNIADKDPLAAFSYSPASPEAESPIQFSDESTSHDSIISRSWAFGDGNTSPEQDPVHTYTSADTYTVTLTVGEGDGDSDTATQSIVVSAPNEPPVADAGSDQSANEGDTVAFDGSSSSDDGTIVSYEWDFDDGSSGAGETTSHVYADNGTYTVTLTVTDNNEATDTDAATVTIDNIAPTVNAGPDETVDEGDTVSFSGSFTDPGSADTHTIEWDFGDSSTASGTLTTTHVYADNGSYTVALTVTDDDGGATTDSAIITVNNVAPVAEAGGPYSGIEAAPITFTGSATDPGTADTLTYSWDFGDASPAQVGQTVSHTYSALGTYTVSLTVTDDDGGVGADTATVTVKTAGPTAHASIDMSKWGSWSWAYVATTVTLTEGDALGPALTGASVYGHWSGAYTGDVSGTTTSTGEVGFSAVFYSGGGGTVTFTVDRVVNDGEEYALSGETSSSI
ncbi:PKD domain-containing protein, partial [Chloroflexota bacterium]